MISEVEIPENEKEKTSLSSQTISFLSLQDGIVEKILARISKWTYPNLSLVSKRFLTLLSSPQLYMTVTRSLIGTTEPCLYICLDSLSHPCPEWYTLSMIPHETLTDNNEILKSYSLIPLHSSSHSPLVSNDSTVVVGSEIYVIGGIYIAPASSSVRILDCRSDTWRDAPNMTIARSNQTAVFLDEKLLVVGGVEIDESGDNVFEEFDVKTQTSALSNPDDDHELVKYLIAYPYRLHVSCVMENVMYCCNYFGSLMWYDSECKEWRLIKGLEELRDHRTRDLTMSLSMDSLVNYGGKLVLVWMRKLKKDNEKQKIKIWCVKIGLEKRHKNEMWGKIEWINIVHNVHNMYDCLTCVAVSI